jgi:hypothetical protein
MNMFLVEDFIAKKAAFDKAKLRMDKAVTLVFAEYARQKAEVSAYPKRWRNQMKWKSYRLGTIHLHLELGFWRGDQYDSSRLELPVELVQIAAESDYDVDALVGGIAKIIKEEGEDIAQREAIQTKRLNAYMKTQDDAILARAEEIRKVRNNC